MSLVQFAIFAYHDSNVPRRKGEQYANGLVQCLDPRPDYYRYLPTYYYNDPYQFDRLQTFFQNNPDELQLDWDRFIKSIPILQTRKLLLYLMEALPQALPLVM